MNPHRKGNAFPQAGVPGDPRLLDQLHRQMVRGPNMQITHTHSGTLLTPRKNKTVTIPPHPWKCTSNGDDTVTVSPGFTLGTTSQDSPGLGILPSFALLKPLDSYIGGDVIVTGAGYIVGYVAFSYGTIVYETEALTSVEAEYVPINTVRLSVGNGVNVEFSADFPDGTTPGNYYFVIAKVSLSDDDVAVVEEQYLHHNPALDIYLVDGQ